MYREVKTKLMKEGKLVSDYLPFDEIPCRITTDGHQYIVLKAPVMNGDMRASAQSKEMEEWYFNLSTRLESLASGVTVTVHCSHWLQTALLCSETSLEGMESLILTQERLRGLQVRMVRP